MQQVLQQTTRSRTATPSALEPCGTEGRRPRRAPARTACSPAPCA